jgi:hypothetical protein
MKRTMVSYKVKPDQAAVNEELLRDVFDELRELDPPGVRYEAFVLDDGVSFVHLVEYDGDNPIPELATFKRYTAEVRERCEAPPVVSQPREIGSVGLAWAARR